MPLKITRNGYICSARIDRPDARNAINFELMDRFESLLDELEQSEDYRVFILTGTGKSFISGGDLREFHQIKKAEPARLMGKRMHKILQRIEELPMWTVAAVNGYAYGGGWEIMLAFDFRVSVQSAAFGFTQGKFYLPPGWGGLTRLTETTGRKTALWLLATQEVLDSDQALDFGLINRICPDDNFNESVQELANQLSVNGREFIMHLKKKSMLRRNELYQNIKEELEPFGHFWEHDEHIRRVNNFLDKKSKS